MCAKMCQQDVKKKTTKKTCKYDSKKVYYDITSKGRSTTYEMVIEGGITLYIFWI